jgi:hypothetical protein
MGLSDHRGRHRARAFFGDDAHRCPGDVRSEQGTARAYPVSDDHAKTTRIKFATWNVGSLTGKSREIVDVMQRRKINVMCIQEVKWTGQSAREIGDGYKVLYSGGKSKKNGVGVILDPELKSEVIDVTRHSDRLMLVKIAVHSEVVNVITGYAPQTGCTQEEKDAFIVDMEALVRALPITERIVIGADMNGHVGVNSGDYEGVHGGHGFGDINEEGNTCLEMAQGLDLVIANTCFKKPEEHLITYRNGPYASQIDYLLVRQTDRKCIIDCKIIPGEAAVKQHRVLIMTMQLRCKSASKRSKQKERIRTWKLKGDNLLMFRQEVQTTMNRSEEVTWDKLKSSVVESAKKICGVTRGQRRKERETWWWMEEVQEAIQNKKMAFKNWQGNRQDATLKAVYKVTCKAAKKAVAMAKSKSMKLIYEELNTMEGEAKIYKIAKARQRNRQDKQSIKMIKDIDGNILTEEEAIRTRWKSYFDELLNVENAREPLEQVSLVEGPENEITRKEIQMAIKQMKSNKAPGPSGITAEMIKALGQDGIDWLYIILNDFMKNETLPTDMKESEIVTIYKQKGDALECGNYRGIKLLEIVLKIYERVIERRIREKVHIHENQFGFMPGRGTVDAIFILRQVQEKILEGNNKRYWTFVDLEKAFDRVPREVVFWSLRRKGVSEKIIRVIKSMYDEARTAVRSGAGCTAGFEIRVGVHQGSCLSPLLFIIVMDAISEAARREVPWDMLYADDLILAEDSASNLQIRFSGWQRALESKGLKVNANKTETMVCSKEDESVAITDSKGNILKQVETFKYLGSTVNAKGGCEEDVKNRIKAAWQKWKDLSGVVCDRKMPVGVKGKVYKTMIRTVMIYGAEAWSPRRKEEELLERTEMRMLRWILGVSLKDRKTNEDIRQAVGVACITDKIREARLRWYGHVQRREDDSCIKKIMKAEVYGHRSRGRQKKRWSDTVQQDLVALRLKPKDANDRDKWRRRTHVADPSPVRD